MSYSNNPYAPKISYDMYLNEKAALAGISIGSVIYGKHKAPPPTCPSIRAHPVRLYGYFRDPHCSVLPMHFRALQPHQSQKGWYQVGSRILHRRHVFVCDRAHRDDPPPSVHFLHR